MKLTLKRQSNQKINPSSKSKAGTRKSAYFTYSLDKIGRKESSYTNVKIGKASSYSTPLEICKDLTKRERFSLEIDKQESSFAFFKRIVPERYEGKFIIYYDLRIRGSAVTFQDAMKIVNEDFRDKPVLVKRFHKDPKIINLGFLKDA